MFCLQKLSCYSLKQMNDLSDFRIHVRWALQIPLNVESCLQGLCACLLPSVHSVLSSDLQICEIHQQNKEKGLS